MYGAIQLRLQMLYFKLRSGKLSFNGSNLRVSNMPYNIRLDVGSFADSTHSDKALEKSSDVRVHLCIAAT